MANINKLFNGRNNAKKFLDDYYGSMILEAKRKAAEKELEPEQSKAETKHKKYLLDFINENKNNEKNKNEQIFEEYFFYNTPLFLAKELCNSDRNINDEIVKHVNDALIESKKHINRKKFSDHRNLNKIVNVVEKTKT